MILSEVKVVVGIRLSKDEIRSFCQRHRIRRLALFGSVLRPDFDSESDIDVLVEFERGTKVGFFELYDMEQELSRILGGRKVDLNTPNSLSKYFREQALSEAQVEYVKA
jgi:predicted nucleotidyltransferase